MSFQEIRGTLEKATYDALRTAGVASDNIYFDGVGQSRQSADSTWVQVALSFTDVKQDLIGCDCGDDIRGSVQCNIYTPDNQGSKAGEDIAAAVLRAWSGTLKWDSTVGKRVRCRNLEGPRTVQTAERNPHRVHVITAAFAGVSS